MTSGLRLREQEAHRSSRKEWVLAKIKRNDQIIVIAGKDKGKKGRVLRVVTEKYRVLVEGVGMFK